MTWIIRRTRSCDDQGSPFQIEEAINAKALRWCEFGVCEMEKQKLEQLDMVNKDRSRMGERQGFLRQAKVLRFHFK